MAVPDDEVDRLRIVLGRISRMVDRQVPGDGMTRTQLSVLGTIARRQTMGMSELAEREGLNPTMLSRIVGNLEAAALVSRTPGPDDRRSVVVEITATGAKLQARRQRERTRLFAERLGRVDPQRTAALLDALPALESLADAMRPDRDAGARPAHPIAPMATTR
jgi:DNA-binding MarR family transcriptional regulator